MREFKTAKRHNRVETLVNYQAFTERPVSLEPPKFFNTPEPDAERRMRDAVLDAPAVQVAAFAGEGPVDELIDEHEAAGRQLLAERAASGSGACARRSTSPSRTSAVCVASWVWAARVEVEGVLRCALAPTSHVTANATAS